VEGEQVRPEDGVKRPNSCEDIRSVTSRYGSDALLLRAPARKYGWRPVVAGLVDPRPSTRPGPVAPGCHIRGSGSPIKRPESE
jgi:hypothetical protein